MAEQENSGVSMVAIVAIIIIAGLAAWYFFWAPRNTMPAAPTVKVETPSTTQPMQTAPAPAQENSSQEQQR